MSRDDSTDVSTTAVAVASPTPVVPSSVGLEEELNLNNEQNNVYDAAYRALNQPSDFLATTTVPKIVSLESTIPDEDSTVVVVTPVTPSRGQHELFRALESLDGLEKDEQTLALQSDLTRILTELITGSSFINSQQAIQNLDMLGQAVPRRVCQHPFKKNDIVWVCRTCQADETCVLCHACYSQSNHEGHDVAFYHAQAGGCCDCGDPDAWDPAGFCPRHGPDANGRSNQEAALPPNLVDRVRGVIPSCVDWLVRIVAKNAEAAYTRANPVKPKRQIQKMKSAITEGSSVSPRPPPSRSLTLPDNNNMDLDSEFDEDDDDEIPIDTFPLGHPVPSGGHVFSPTAASTSRSPRLEEYGEAAAATEALALTGRRGGGLYIILHADDIHTTPQLSEALQEFLGTNYYTESLLMKMITNLRQYGQLVVWGNMETVVECGATQVKMWMDGDKIAGGRIGAAIMRKAGCLARRGLFCSILTRDELILEQRAVALLQWVAAVARSCDPLCLTVAECILPNRHLVPLLRADFKMSARITKVWYSLLLTLLAVPTFKSHLAAAYCDTYRIVTAKYARGMGVLERSGYTLSVQFLNRVTYVIDLVQGRDLLGKLGKSLLETFMVAARTEGLNGRLDPNHFVLTHRRYSPCISDLKCVLNVNGMPRVIAAKGGTFLTDWIATLSLAQSMDMQIWRHHSQGHVEAEMRGWVGAFNASISLGSLFERLLGWADEEKSPIQNGPLSEDLMPCVELTLHILANGVLRWQQSERVQYVSTPLTSSLEPHRRAPASLPFPTVAAKKGTALAMKQLPVSQVSPFSFHLPLHRFVSACFREVCLRKDDGVGGMSDLLRRLRTHLTDRQFDELFEGLMEFAVLVLSRAAQVRAGLWRHNGAGLNDQVLNYAEPPFCRNMRDADLLMAQFAVIGRTKNQSPDVRPQNEVGFAFLINLMIQRLGLFEFLGLAKAPNWNIASYSQEIAKGLYPAEQSNPKVEDDDLTLPWTFSPARDSSSSMLLLEEFLHFVIIFTSELPPVVPQSKAEQTEQAKNRLFREVVHRLASGSKTHSELSEVHHVLSHWDNVLLSEEGRLLNPDDATGAALGAVLEDVADRKVSKGKMEPDKWELRRSAWDSYDPSFYHINLRSHQTAAENRPKPVHEAGTSFGWKSRPFAPSPTEAHPFFDRLRRDATADGTILAVLYRVLHLHCRVNTQRSLDDLRGKLSYENKEKSETALARTIHLLTLGAFAWRRARADDSNWRACGGGSAGSVFANRKDSEPAPTVRDWVKESLLTKPKSLLDCDWYDGEEQSIVLLRRLAVHGGVPGGFIAQDSSVRAGAAWLCEFALSCCPEASQVITPLKSETKDSIDVSKAESEFERRKKMAKEKALARMKAQAEKVASMMDVDFNSEDDSVIHGSQDVSIPSAPGTPRTPGTPVAPMRKGSFGSSVGSSSMMDSETGGLPNFVSIGDTAFDEQQIPPRLLHSRPRCIICNDEDGADGRLFDKADDDGESQRKKSRRRTENALGFVGYAQPSTVLKGGGGPPPDPGSPMSPVREFVGTHVALCGHAVHSECCESYLSTVSRREELRIGKRDEFRCPLCQRLSNCLVPFIDVGVDWTEIASCIDTADIESKKSGDDMQLDGQKNIDGPLSLHDFLDSTPWWISRQNKMVIWDGQCAFIDRTSCPQEEDEGSTPNRKPPRIRALKKKDLYAAWNAVMRTPRLVRRRLRRSSSRSSNPEKEGLPLIVPTGEESIGETVVWRRFMDQISDISYRADTKRLGETHLHGLFGEFRHYIVEKYGYNMANRFTGNEPTDWPSCMYNETLPDTRRQEMAREKLLSKLLLSIQSFAYSCCCEIFEARRQYRIFTSHSREVARKSQDLSLEALFSRFGIDCVCCDGRLVIMPHPALNDSDGSKPFDGRLGKLRYLGLAVMAASGAVAADLVQLVLPFPVDESDSESVNMEVDTPERAPIAFPLLFGNVLTHVVAAMCSTCGRARARSDLMDFAWPAPFSSKGNFRSSELFGNGDSVDCVMDDCEGFLKLGLLARVLQVLLGFLELDPSGSGDIAVWLRKIKNTSQHYRDSTSNDDDWIRFCVRLLEISVSNHVVPAPTGTSSITAESIPEEKLRNAALLAALAACSYLGDAGSILHVLIPGFMARHPIKPESHTATNKDVSAYVSLQKLLQHFQLEPLHEIVESSLVQAVVSHWFDTACRHATAATGAGASDDAIKLLRSRLYKTRGFPIFDWPSACDMDHMSAASSHKDSSKLPVVEQQPQDDSTSGSVPVANILSQSSQASTADVVRGGGSPTLLTFNSKKSVSLLGGFSPDTLYQKDNDRPRVMVIPTSYTDLYAELGALMPDCEQTAVCLICGEVLNAGGKGECTRHSVKCGAGAGMFFLLQECSGLIMHKSKAAYVHSPYVDSHGETPQYRGRPLNLDLDRYEHLRQVWFSHSVRQKVVAERGVIRQVIMQDFY